MELIQLAIISYSFLLALTLVGNLISPRKVTKPAYFPILGFGYLILTTSILSNLMSLSVSNSLLVSLFLLIPLIVFKNNFLFLILKPADLFFQILLVTLTLGILAFERHFFGVVNFDFFNAAQDGRFLLNHGTLETNFINSILPATWSAGTGSRYAVSFVIAGFLRLFPNLNPLLIAEGILVVLFALGISTFIQVIKDRVALPTTKVYFLGILSTFSFFSIYALNNQMFGQITALPFVYFLFTALPLGKWNFREIFITTSAFFVIFMLYPPILPPTILGLIFFFFHQSKRNLLNIRSVLQGFLCILILFFSIYSSNVSWPWKMLWSFVSPQIQDLSQNFQANLFPQIVSAIGPGQILGFIPLSYSGSWNVFFVTCIFLFSAFFLLIFIGGLFKFFEEFKSPVIYLIVALLIFLVYAFVTQNSYVVFKIAVWLGLPIFLLTVAFLIFSLSDQIGKNENKFFLHIVRFVLTIFVVSNLFLSSNQILGLRNNKSTSFPNTATITQLNTLSAMNFNRNEIIGIVTPTAEEAAWISSAFKPNFLKNLVNVGTQNQASLESRRKECNFSQTLAAAKTATSILTRNIIEDVTPPILTDGPSIKIGQDFRSIPITSLEKMIIVESGLFPPTLNRQISKNPIPNSEALRWGMRNICLIVYSNLPKDIHLTIPVLRGPEMPEKPIWFSATGKLTNSQSPDGIIYLDLVQRLESGWNTVEISLINHQEYVPSGWYKVRADSRTLSFAIGKILASYS